MKNFTVFALTLAVLSLPFRALAAPSTYPINFSHGCAYNLVVGACIPTVTGGSATWGAIIGTLSDQSDLQTALNGKQATIGYVPENIASKSVDGTFAANSDVLYPSQKAAKTYIDTGLAGKQNSLGFTAENVANKDTDGTFAANSDVKYPSQKAAKTYVDTGLAGKQNSLTFGSISTTTVGVTVGSGANSTVGPAVTVDIQNATNGQPGLLTAADHTAFAAKEPAIAAGTTLQYWRGDKSWQTLDTAVVPENTNLYYTNARAIAAPLTGYVSGAGVVAATDSILQAVQKLDGNTAAKEDAGVDWRLLGNAGTTAGTNFIGTTDAIDLVFKTNSNEAMRIDAAGLVNMPLNNASTIAYFDSLKNLRSLNGTQVQTWGGVYDSQSTDPAPNPGAPSGYQMSNINMQVAPTGPASNNVVDGRHLAITYDPGNTGFAIGTSGGQSLLSLDAFHPSSGAMGSLTMLNINANVGDSIIVGGSVSQISGVNGGISVQAGHSVGGIQGFSTGGQMDGNFSTGGYNGVTVNENFSSGVTGMTYYTGYGVFSNLANNMTAGNNLNGFNNGLNFQNGFTAGYVTGFAQFPVFHSGSHVTGAQGISIGDQFDAGSLVDQNYTALQVNPHGTGTLTQGAMGLNIDLTQLTSVDKGLLKAIQTRGGALDVNFDWDSSATLGTAIIQTHSLQSNFTIASGHPIVNTGPLTPQFGFGTNIGGNFAFEDDYNVDFTGARLGYSMVGSLGGLAGTAGKTVDMFNLNMAAAAVQAGTGGLINDANVYRAIGILPNAGVPPTITNITAFHVDPAFDASLGTNKWGVKVDSTTANNYFAKNVVIGGVTGTPTGAYALDVTGNVNVDGFLYGPSIGKMADITNGTLYDGTVVVVDLVGHQLKNASAQSVLQWDNLQMYDGVQKALDWGNRSLHNSAGTDVLEWFGTSIDVQAGITLDVAKDFVVGSTTPTNSSVGIELSSTSKALLISRMTTAQRTALTAVNGMQVYDTDLDLFECYAGGAWGACNTSSGTVSAVSASSPLASSGGSTPNITITQADATHDGFVTQVDWNTFNNKQAALGFTPVPDTRTVNGHALNANVTVTKADVGLGNVANTAQVTNVTGTAPIASTGGTTPDISIAIATSLVDGALSHNDFVTFNGKEPPIATGGIGQYWRGDKTWQNLNATAVGLSNVTNNAQVTSVGGTAPVVSSGGLTPVISMHVADSTHDGYLLQGDWTTFNNKLSAIPAMPVSAKVANYTLTSTDRVITACGTFTLTLPAATTVLTNPYTIKSICAGTVTIVTTGADTVEFGASIVLNTQGQSVDLFDDGAAAWYTK